MRCKPHSSCQAHIVYGNTVRNSVFRYEYTPVQGDLAAELNSKAHAVAPRWAPNEVLKHATCRRRTTTATTGARHAADAAPRTQRQRMAAKVCGLEQSTAPLRSVPA